MIKNILTVDLEDWYQSSLELFRDRERPEGIVYPSERVVVNTHKLLALFAEHKVSATFFVLGTVAEKYPDLVKRIEGQGHEIYDLTERGFREDIERSLEILSGVTSAKIRGYRAPYFSVTKRSSWAFKALLDYDFEYDSSVFMMRRRICGFLDYKRHLDKANQNRERKLLEFPASSVELMGRRIPFCGGAPLRIFPLFFHKWAIRRFNGRGNSALMYLHPYELDSRSEESFRELSNHSGFRPKWIKYTQGFMRSTVPYKVESLLGSNNFTSIVLIYRGDR
jgi:polysaccharide deacetylase family protein (PEP-CTERM system associated)